jgi:hypothetical protein
MFQVSLIVAGDRAKENLILPKYTSPVINKYIRPLCNPYLELVNAFYTNNMSELQVRFYKFKSQVGFALNLGKYNTIKVQDT